MIIYQNTEDSHPTVITWVHIDMSVLHIFLSNSFCSMEWLLRIFHQLLLKKPVNFLMQSVKTPQNVFHIAIIHVQCFDKII